MIQQQISLKPYNTFAVNAVASEFCEVASVNEVRMVLAQTRYARNNILVLGGGSNVLFTKDYDGLVIRNVIKGIKRIRESDDQVWLEVGAGENWHQFVMETLKRGYQGLENLSLIPGCVGGAPIQNIGAYGVEVATFIESLTAIKLADGSLFELTHDDCAFGYRDSVFKQALKQQALINTVVFRLNKKPILQIDYPALSDELRHRHIHHPSAEIISDIVMNIRQKKLPDPKQLPNAGSFFKNPIIEKSQYAALLKCFAQLPHYVVSDQKVKLPAAWLIDQCGFKGKRFNAVGVHVNQALVLVNYGEGTGGEIKALSEMIQNAVDARFSIQLEAEVNMI